MKLVSDIVNEIVSNLPKSKLDDSLEQNFGLLSALKEISGMVPPPPAMDWSVSHFTSLINEDDSNLDLTGRGSIQRELLESIMSSTPRNNVHSIRNKRGEEYDEHDEWISTLKVSPRIRTNSLPSTSAKIVIFDRDIVNENCDDEESEHGKSKEEIIEELKNEYGKNGNENREMELKIDKLTRNNDDSITDIAENDVHEKDCENKRL